MFERYPRRNVLKRGLATGALLGMGDLAFLGALRPVSAEEARLAPESVRPEAGIDDLVRLLEETPRNRLLEEVGARVQQGLSYRELLAALLLAGVKNVEPRPSVGHKFHSVLVVNSAHLASLSSPPEHRWLPIFWALDYFKSAQARDVRERGDWRMAAVDEGAVPPAHKAANVFQQAMEDWDEEAADAAVAGLARTAGANEIYEMFFRIGCRDFRSIGHKAIYVANSYRTLSCIGWQHSEPVLRSLAYALLMHEGDNPARRDAEADRPFRRNQELVADIRSDWRDGKRDDRAAEDLQETLRSESNDAACDHVVELLNQGVSAQSAWDAMQTAAGELLTRQPGIVALHAVTTTNALAFAYRTCADDQTRRLLLLQNAAFLPMFRESMGGRGRVADTKVADLVEAASAEEETPTIEAIFERLGDNPTDASAMALRYLNADGADPARAKELIDAARVLVFLKGDDAHDYKFSSAILEDYYHVSPAWRNAYLAANLPKLQATTQADNGLVQRTRAALET